MAKNVIQRAELQARMQRGMHLKDSAPAPHMADTLVPVVIIEDLSRIDDNIQLSDQRPFWGNLTQGAGGAGLFSKVFLVNVDQGIASQNKIVVIDRLIVNASGGGDVKGQIEAVAGGSVAGFNRDARYTPAQGSKALLDFATPGAGPGTWALQFPSSSLPQVLDLGIVIPAGFQFAVYHTVANQSLMATFFWREFDSIIK